jgi:hypothetical protein
MDILKGQPMIYPSINYALVGLAIATGFGCGKKSDSTTPAPAPNASPTPQPVVDVDPLIPDKPAPGYMFEDLVKGSYCTVTVKSSDQTYLLAKVKKLSNDVAFDFTYYYPKDGNVAYNGYVLSSFMLTQSDCDLVKMIDAEPVPLLLAPLYVYANQDLSGEPVCTVPAGSNSVGETDVEIFSKYAHVKFKSADTCPGLESGFLKSAPNIIALYVK